MNTTELSNTTKGKYGFLDILFFVLFVITGYYTRNNAARLMMVFFCLAVFGYYFVNPFTKKHTFYFKGTLLFILYGYFLVYTGRTINAEVASTMVVSLMLNLIMAYTICQYILWKQEIHSVAVLIVGGIFIVACIVLAQTGGGLGSDRLGKDTELNANMLAMLSVYAMILSYYLLKHSRHNVIYTFMIIFFIAVILLSGSRKGLIMIILAFLIINLFEGKTNVVKNILLIAMLAFVLYYLVMKIPILYDTIGNRLEELINLIFKNKTKDESLLSRQELIETGWDYIYRRPWQGYGYDCFKTISGITSSNSSYNLYSHNNYIELLFGGGIIGFVLYYIPVASVLIGLIKNLKKDPVMIYMLAILVSKLAVEYAYVSYYSRMDTYIIAVLLGCVLWCKEKKELTEETVNAISKKITKKSI